MFGPLRIPKKAWDSLIHAIEPVIRQRDGRVLRRFRFLDPENGPVYTEDPMDEMPFVMSDQKIEPMKMPSSRVLYDNTVKDLEEAWSKTSGRPKD